MKQIVDKLNKIAKAIDENVELSDRDLIIDSLDSITKAFGGTPNESNLIVDKLEDIAGVAHGGGGGGLTIPHLTINALNEGEGPAYLWNYNFPMYILVIENGYAYNKKLPNSAIEPNGTLQTISMYEQQEYGGQIKCVFPPLEGYKSIGNYVNCELQELQGPIDIETLLVILDPTQNASFDVVVEGTR